MNIKTILQALILVILGILYYLYMNTPSFEQVQVESVIDGDTIALTNGLKVRLLGINTPEKDMPGYQIAKNYLSEIAADNVIYIDRKGTDRYGRLLAYIFTKEENKNVNAMILEQGYGHLYYYDKDKYYKELEKSETHARENNRGIWEPSPYTTCLFLVELNYYDKGDDVETLTVENNCAQELDIIIKDDATHIYKETISLGSFTKEFKNIFNDDGDTLYVWDEDGKLIVFHRYE